MSNCFSPHPTTQGCLNRDIPNTHVDLISSIFLCIRVDLKRNLDQTDAMVCWPDTHLIDVNNEVNGENSPCEDKV